MFLVNRYKLAAYIIVNVLQRYNPTRSSLFDRMKFYNSPIAILILDMISQLSPYVLSKLTRLIKEGN